MKKAAILLCFIPLIFCGCWDQEVFEENTIILGAGVEKNQDSTYHFTFVSGNNGNSEDALSINTTEAFLISEALNKTNNHATGALKSGKIQTIIFAEDVAREGYITKIDSHKIEEVNRFLSDYAVSETSPEQVFKTINLIKPGDEALSYLDDLLNNAAKSGFCPDVSYYDYDLDFLNSNIDPILPLIAAENNKIVVKGTALFKDKKMVAKLSAEESVFAMLAINKTSDFAYTIGTPYDLGGENKVIFQTNRCSSKVSTSIENNKLKLKVKVKINGFFDKIIWAELVEKVGYKKAHAITEQYFKRNIEQVFATVQSYETDPFNVQGMVNGYHHNFYETHDFREAYKNAKVTVETKVNIKNQENPTPSF
ncbi:MAG: Ger(x)C family spore germination protein [Clostridiales bacterium]